MKKILCSLAVVTSIFANSDIAKDYEDILNTNLKSIPLDGMYTFNNTSFRCFDRNRSISCKNQGFDISAGSSSMIKADSVNLSWSYFYDGGKSGIISMQEALSNILEKDFKDRSSIEGIVLSQDAREVILTLVSSYTQQYGLGDEVDNWINEILSGKFDLSMLAQSDVNGFDANLQLELNLADNMSNIDTSINIKGNIKNYKSVFAKLDNAGFKYDANTNTIIDGNGSVDYMLGDSIFVKTIEFRLFVRDLSLIEPSLDMFETMLEGSEMNELLKIISDIKSTHEIKVKIEANAKLNDIDKISEPDIYINGIYINNLAPQY